MRSAQKTFCELRTADCALNLLRNTLPSQRGIHHPLDIDHGAAYGNTLTWTDKDNPKLGAQPVEIQMDLDLARFNEMFVELMGNIKNEVLNNLFRSTSNLMAFEKFRKCPVDDPMKDTLYNLALDFERKRQLNKAVSVYATKVTSALPR